jgi:hypothetical protein
MASDEFLECGLAAGSGVLGQELRIALTLHTNSKQPLNEKSDT